MSARPEIELAPFGQRLAFLMERAGIRSKKEFMAQVGISPMSLGRYERGERDPSASTIVAMAKALGCSADALLGLSTPEMESLRRVVREEVRGALTDMLTGMIREAEKFAGGLR